MATSDVLNFTANGSNLNDTGEIRIIIKQQYLFALPSEAFLLFKGRLLKADGTAYANADAVSLTSNVFYPGQATTMLGMLKYPNDFQLVQGLNQLWTKDSGATAKPDAKGTFLFCVPIRYIFGFCDDYNKVIYRFEHTLTLVRKSDNDAVFRNAAAAAGKVNFDKISLFMPHVRRALMEKKNLLDAIASKLFHKLLILLDFTRLSVKTSSEKARYIIVGFQTKSGNQETNPSIFDHCDLKNMQIYLNEENVYSAVPYNLSFRNQHFSRAYREATTYSEKFYGLNEMITKSNIAPSDYKDLYPLMVFDVSKQSGRYKLTVIDVQIRATFNQIVPAGTQVYAVVISVVISNVTISSRHRMNIVY
ncbi:uncharacterized protein LOC124812902 [Hydra vulgaris]|uniref:uncharacterized protein LOC124812902 n=1 Tax=Hydra vulgaris TaxID=6087 RepID=UPI001F5E51A6|nr:uncharacterized protein LOC124812902 [Hydra vulgaris]